MSKTTLVKNLTLGGTDPGYSVTANPQVNAQWVKAVTVSAGNKREVVTLPDNAFIARVVGVVTQAVSALSQGLTLNIGEPSSAAAYAVRNALGVATTFTATQKAQCASAKTVAVEVTASVAASAGDFTQGKVTVFLVGGTYPGGKSTVVNSAALGETDNGQGAGSNPQRMVGWVRAVDVSAGGFRNTITLPDNSFIARGIVYELTSASVVTQGLRIFIGEPASAGAYATVTTSVAGVTTWGPSAPGFSAKTVTVAVSASVAASAADLTDYSYRVIIIGGQYV